MKNKFILIVYLYFLLFGVVSAEPFSFKSSNIEILDNGNLIYANDGKAISYDKDLEIEAKKFEYSKISDSLKAYENGVANIISENLEIKFDELIIDQKSSIIEAYGNVQIYHKGKGLLIKTSEVVYNQNKDLLSSSTKSFLTDKLKNNFNVDNFKFEIKKDILKIENAKFKDIENNTFQTSLAFINTKTNKLFGKDVSVNLNNNSFNENNEPRLKGNSIIKDDHNAEITKGVFTTCKKREKCPPWQLASEKIHHDSKKKVINYKNALLKIYDVPVMYFPKFFHPDPTVKRRSGFLIPTLKNSSDSDNYLNVPYFFALAENRDATFYPRFYTEDKFLIQTEYREKNYKSNHFSDFSFYTEKNEETKNHFFYEYDKSFDLEYFDENNFDFKIQQVSNDTYLKANKIISPIIDDNDILENSFGLNLYSNNLSIDTEMIAYENLGKKDSDRFEYIFPKFNFEKKIANNSNLNGEFSFKSQNLVRNYDTNIFEKTNINELIFNSYPLITKIGLYNDYEFVIKNSNTDTQNSKRFKEDENYYLSSLFQINSTLPLIKENEKFQKILKPKASLKIAPPNNTKDIRYKDTKIDVNNIYSLNRVSENDIIESGISLTLGNDYSIFDKDISKEIFAIKLANNLRLEEDGDLPRNNQIGSKISNIFSEIMWSPNEFLNVKYDTSIKNNLSDINYENLTTELKVNNFVTTFDYLNENNTIDKNSYLTNKTRYFLDDFNSLAFSTRENKTLGLTEYYNLIYEYKNDCLSASIEYNKDYYSDRDVKPAESIFLKLTIIPFGETSSPNLRN